MSPIELLGFTLGTGFASGLNLYATLTVVGLLQRFQVVALPAGLEVLGHPLVLGLTATLFVVEFLADKIPWLDSAWDTVHTFIRPPAAAALAFGAFGDTSDPWRIAAALLAGGVALTSHGAKASTRAAANTSPEPFSNWVLSLVEDGLAVFLTWMALEHPVIAVILVLILLVAAVMLIRAFARFVGRVGRRLRGAPAEAGGQPPPIP